MLRPPKAPIIVRPVTVTRFRRSFQMRLYATIFRLAVLASLIVTAALCAGWKWGHT
jgi:hypothetical protein